MILSMQIGYAEGVSYKLVNSSDKERCEIFLHAVKASKLAEMSDRQLCKAMNSPISETLQSRYINEINWTSVQVKNKHNLVTIARNIIVSDMMGRRFNSVGKKQFMDDFSGPHGVISRSDVAIETASIKLNGFNYYLVRLRRNRCNLGEKKFSVTPIWGFMEGGGISSGMINNLSTGLPAGNLFLLKDRLYVFQDDGWRKEIDSDVGKNYQTISIMSIDSASTGARDSSIYIGSECVVVAHNPLRKIVKEQ
jgi:hypothetical protein